MLMLALACRHTPAPVRTAIGDVPGVLTLQPCLHRDSIPAECGTLTVPESMYAASPWLASLTTSTMRARRCSTSASTAKA